MSHLQTPDSGIIQNANYHFKILLVHHLLAKLEWKDVELNITILDAIHFITIIWDCVSLTTIANCFAECGFVKPFEGQIFL